MNSVVSGFCASGRRRACDRSAMIPERTSETVFVEREAIEAAAYFGDSSLTERFVCRFSGLRP